MSLKSTVVAIAFLPALILLSCQENPDKQAILKADSINRISLADTNDFYSIRLAYPDDSLDWSGEMKTFAMNMFEAKKAEWKIGGPTWQSEQRISRDFPDRAQIKYEFVLEYSQYKSTNLHSRSYLFTAYEYSGGANGNSSVTTFTFNEAGKIQAKDILNLENHNDVALSRLLAEEALKDKETFNADMLYNGLGLSFLKSDGFSIDMEKCNCEGFSFADNFQNFILSDSGITFVFSEYQIAPGSSGTPAINLPWDRLKPFLHRKISTRL